MAIISTGTLQALAKSGIVRLFAIEFGIAIAVFSGFAWWTFKRLEYESQRRDEHIVTREIDRIARLGDEQAVYAELERLRASDHRITPDINYVFIRQLRECQRRSRITVLGCADLALWVDEGIGAETIDLAGTLGAPTDEKVAGSELSLTKHTLQRAFDWWTSNAYYQGRRIRPDTLLLVGIDRHFRNQERWWLLGWTIAMFAAFVLLSVGIATAFILLSSRRIHSFNTTLDRVSQGKIAERIALRGAGDEIDRLGMRVNAMLDQIQEQFASLRRFTDQVAHELRTPLTRVRSRLENVRDATGTEETRSQINSCLRDFDETIAVFNSVLELARIESSAAPDNTVVDVSEVVADVAEIFLPAAEQNGQQLKVHARPVAVFGRSELLQRMVANLVDNAIKYAGPAATITVSCGVEATHGFIEVKDDGHGLSGTEWRKVLELGARGSTSGQAPGTGLGLFLVRRIAALHRMELKFEDAHPGVCARLEFAPVAPQ